MLRVYINFDFVWLGDIKDLIFIICVWFGERNSREIENSFYVVEKKNERIENVVYINHLLH